MHGHERARVFLTKRLLADSKGLRVQWESVRGAIGASIDEAKDIHGAERILGIGTVALAAEFQSVLHERDRFLITAEVRITPPQQARGPEGIRGTRSVRRLVL